MLHIMHTCLKSKSYTVIYVCGVRVSTGQFGRLSCESEGIALARGPENRVSWVRVQPEQLFSLKKELFQL